MRTVASRAAGNQTFADRWCITVMLSNGLRWPRRSLQYFLGTFERVVVVTKQLNKRGRLQLGIIALAFFGPMILATWMYATGQLHPSGSTNHGRLIDPVINLEEALSGSSPILTATGAPWRLLYANEASCDESCRDALHRLRQIRLMLGKDMDRVGRIFLHGESQPDNAALLEPHPGLITMSDKALGKTLDESRPQDLPAGGIYLVDPLDNLIMYFSPDIVPRDMADDLKHLLRLSRIG